ncbi:MAG: hypothetical protein J5637_08315 [Prevotella sp.]|nr:hypothetical protein [Prevotella sp.]
MLQFRPILVLCAIVTLCACNSDKKRIQTYIDNYHPDTEIELEGDVNVDSTFCPLTALDATSLEIMGHRMNLLHLLEVNPDSAFILARQLNQKYAGDNAFASLAYPTGPKNRLSYQVKCKVDGNERYVVFFKNVDDDNIESSSLEVDEAIDSLMSSFTMLRNGLRIILNDSNTPAETKRKADKAQREEAEEAKAREPEHATEEPQAPSEAKEQAEAAN